MYVARKSENIQADLKRGFSSWNFGQEGLHACAEQIEIWKSECIESGMPFSISGFDFYDESEIRNADIRELYAGYWVLVDDRFDGSIAGTALKASNLEEAKMQIQTACYFGDGISINIKESTLVYSEGDLHIFAI
jgi:hypothetical protein